MRNGKNILITGIGGYIGRNFTEIASKLFPNKKFYGIDKTISQNINIKFIKCDLTDKEKLKTILVSLKPSIIFNLAGTGISIDLNLQQFVNANLLPTISLLETITELSSIKPRIILIGSAAEYGRIPIKKLPAVENYPLNPLTNYGCAKALQSILANYYTNLGMDIVIARLFNIIGKNMSKNLSIGSFIKQIEKIKRNKIPPKIFVGDINVRRDFIDLRDAIKAICLIAKKGKTGEVYNVCSGRAVSVRNILVKLCKSNSKKIKIVADPKRIRKHDVKNIYGSYKKLYLHTGWKPNFTIEQTLRDIIY